MGLNGSGTYSLPTPEYPAVSGEYIYAATFNTIMEDIAAALSNTIFRDGQAAFAANQAMGGYKFTGCAEAVANDEFVTKAQLDAAISSGNISVDAGTVMLFYQAAAPTGWTKSTAHNDKALRVVSGTGGGSGGTHALSSPPSISHTHTGPSHTHTGPSHVHSGPNHAHTMGSHVHQWYNYIGLSSTNQTYNSAGTAISVTNGATQTAGAGIISGTGLAGLTVDGYTTSVDPGDTAAGGTGATGASGTAATGASGTGTTSTASLTAFAPKYIDVIVCVKD